MTANELFAAMSPGLATRILEEVHGSDKDLYRVALHSVAQTRKVRPVFLERQPKPERHRMMVGTLASRSQQMVAGNVLSGWLVKNQSGLLTEFLDSLKISHEKGVVENLPKSVPDADLESAITSLLAKHDREIVAVYLHAFNTMNEAHWPNLDRMLYEDDRLMLGK
jgi:hypothetical protein